MPTEFMRPDFSERCYKESTRDVIFLLQTRANKKSNYWRTEGVWLSREEAEAFAKATEYNFPNGWRVYGTCANGELAQLLKSI